MVNSFVITDIVWLFLGLLVFFFYHQFRKKFPKHAFFTFDYHHWFHTFIIPILLSFLVLGIFRFVSGTPLISGDYSFLNSLITFIIIGPFFEEFFLRGVILGGSFFISKNLNSKFASWFFITAGFLIQLFIFVWIHGYSSFINNLFLLITGIFYSLLFIYYKKDILVPFVAHAAANVFIILRIFS